MHTHHFLARTANSRLAAALSTLLFVTARAADPAPATAADAKKEEPKKWEGSVAAGVTLTRGNSKNLLATGSFNATRKWEHDTLLLGANAGYGEATTKDGNHEDSSTTDQAPISKAFDVRLVVQWSYNSEPAEDRLKNDVKLIGAIGYRF